MGTVKLSGVAFLCFTEDDSRFQGVVVPSNSGTQLGVAGRLGGPPTNNFDECCFDGQQTFYDITLADDDEGVVIRHVMRIGGDNCTLQCGQLLFETQELLVGRSAEEYIAKNFPERFQSINCYVCIGEMTVYDA